MLKNVDIPRSAWLHSCNSSQPEIRSSVLFCSGYTSDEARLLSVIFERYKKFKKLARPVLNASSTMNVRFGITLIQILDFDEKNQMLATLVWKKYVCNFDIAKPGFTVQ